MPEIRKKEKAGRESEDQDYRWCSEISASIRAQVKFVCFPAVASLDLFLLAVTMAHS